jgi:cell wall-associated NlpC family hydrolase
MDEDEFYEWRDTRHAVATEDYMADDFRLPAGAVLPVIPSRLKGRTVKLRLPTGVPATDGEAEVSVPSDHLNIIAAGEKGEQAARTALEFLTVPYVFGGRSRTGTDCSGLTDVAYEAAGLMLPRDARQQVIVGQMAGTYWSYKSLQPGDLIFFCDNTGKVFHTGVSLGGMRFIHASPPEVHVSSFDPDDEFYSEEWLDNLAFVRRPLP